MQLELVLALSVSGLRYFMGMVLALVRAFEEGSVPLAPMNGRKHSSEESTKAGDPPWAQHRLSGVFFFFSFPSFVPAEGKMLTTSLEVGHPRLLCHLLVHFLMERKVRSCSSNPPLCLH